MRLSASRTTHQGPAGARHSFAGLKPVVAKGIVVMATLGLVLLTAACVSRAPYPAAWDARRLDTAWCETPSGAFANAHVRTSVESEDAPDSALGLKAVFFGTALNGFDVTHLSFETLDGGTVLIKPWVGEQVLKEEKRLQHTPRACRDGVWQVKSEWDALPEAAVAGLLWTGGIVMPMATRATFQLGLTVAGDLSVHATVNTTGTTFLVFPLHTRDADEWFLYPQATRLKEQAM